MSKLLGEKALPHTGMGVVKTWMAIDLNDFRKCSYPVPILNNTSIILSLSAVTGQLYAYAMKRHNPATAMYRTFFYATVGVFTGYYFTRAFNQYYFGKFKYCLDYATFRKNDFEGTLGKCFWRSWIPT
uniref:Uncharacterized protein n=1 Tax=Ciona savignyi TaxID=51511 RepID=H2YI33_CIOSA